jgi:diaminopimelate epimerase
MDYRNADGSVAEMCGNGVRVLARYLADQGLVSGPEFSLATRAGPRAVSLAADGGITVDMGPARVDGTGRAVVGGRDCTGLRVSVGNPHLACLVDEPLGCYDLTAPPVLDRAQFPDGANVELVQVTGPASVAMRVYERGSAETQSCGTGAVAAAVAARRTCGEDSRSWQVTVPGGELGVTIGDDSTWLTGPAVIVAEGDLTLDWIAARA